MLLEDFIFSSAVMGGEWVRIPLAFIGLSIATYYDLFNNRNVPDMFLKAFLAVSILAGAVFFEYNLAIYSIVQALLFGAMLFLGYRAGHVGGADVFVLISLIFLLPIHPSMAHVPFNYPFIFSLSLFAGVLFMLYSILLYVPQLAKMKAKPDFRYLLLIIPYAVLIYLLLGKVSELYLGALSFTLLVLVIFESYKEQIRMLGAEKIPLSRVSEEDVLALEFMPKGEIEKYSLKRIATLEEIARMKKAGVKELFVYTKLQPFMPFLLAGLIFALFFSGALFDFILSQLIY